MTLEFRGAVDGVSLKNGNDLPKLGNSTRENGEGVAGGNSSRRRLAVIIFLTFTNFLILFRFASRRSDRDQRGAAGYSAPA